MLADVLADLELAGKKVTSADRLLAQRYVELLRSRDHSDTNTALKIRQALYEKYAAKHAGEMTLEKYAAIQAKKATP